MTRQATRALLAVVVVLFASAQTPPATAALPSGNLLKNGNFEADTGGDATTEVLPSRWVIGSYPDPTVVSYSTGNGYPDATLSDPMGGGKNFLAGSLADPNGAYRTEMHQIIAIPSTAFPTIDAGNADVVLSADLGGYLTQDDFVHVVAYSLNSHKAPILIGAVPEIQGNLAAGRGNATSFQFIFDSRAVQPKTRFFDVLVDAFRQSDPSGTTANDGYADNMRLEFGTLPKITRALTIDEGSHDVHGVLGSANFNCTSGETVKVFKKIRGPDKLVLKTTTQGDGSWTYPTNKAGTYYAKTGTDGACLAARSPDFRFP